MNLPFNWVDIAILAVLGFGVQRGRKHGMSEELMLLIKWLAIIIVCAFSYSVLGDFLVENTVFSHLASYTIAYLVVALIIAGAFLGMKKLMHGKLIGSDVFGGAEYYLGMAAGMLRYSCILVCAFAFINAPLYTQADLKERQAYENEWYGSDFFPGFQTLQSQVFEKSFVGPYIHSGLGFLLIKSTPFENKGIKRQQYQALPE